ncbi:2647_t:CDS:1, partial [Gigaspora rosea]
RWHGNNFTRQTPKQQNAFMLAITTVNTEGNKMLTRPANNNNECNNTKNDDTESDSFNDFNNSDSGTNNEQ